MSSFVDKDTTNHDDDGQEYMRHAYDTNIDLTHGAEGNAQIDDIESMFDGEDDEIVKRVPRDETTVALHNKPDTISEMRATSADVTPSAESGCGSDCACVEEKKEDTSKSSCCSSEDTSSGGCCSTAPIMTPVEAPASNHVATQGRVHVQTWGCSHNTSDAEYMAGMLSAAGYALVNDPAEADVWVLNSCAVKGPSEHHFLNQLRAGKQQGKGLVLAGCVPQAQPTHKDFSSERAEGAPAHAGVVSIVGVQQLDRVVEAVDETMRGNSVQALSTVRTGGTPLELPKVRRNPYVEIISINTGCLNQCTYCKTKHARGELRSYPVADIRARVERVLAEGVVTVALTSEDLGAYGRDIGTSLPELLDAVVPLFPHGTMLRLGMTNPPYILEHVDALSRYLQHPRVYAFIHIPVQAGSDAVLRDMKRQYACHEFRTLCDRLRAEVPEVTIATDVIAGFPTETDEDWQATMRLCKDYKFPILFTNQFYARPGTPAARYKQLDPRIAKSRTRELTAFFNSYRTRDHKVGRVEDVLVTDVSTDRNYFVGHNKAYDQVLLPKLDGLMGKLVRVRYTAAEKHCLFAELLPGTLEAAPVRPVPAQVSLQQGYVAPASAVLPEDTKAVLEEYQAQWSRGGVTARSEEPVASKKQLRKKERRERAAVQGIDEDIPVAGIAATAMDVPAGSAAVLRTPETTPAPVTETPIESAPEPHISGSVAPSMFTSASATSTGEVTSSSRFVTPDGAIVDPESDTYLYYKPNPHNVDTTAQNKTVEEKLLFNTAPYAIVREDDEDPKRQIVLGIIVILFAILVYRNLP